MLSRARWGAALMGAVAGLIVMVVVSLIVLVISGGAGGDLDSTGQFVVLAFGLFLGQFAAGYVGGRLTSADQPAFHGSLSAMTLYAIISMLGLAAGSPAGILTLLFFGIVAALVGYAGGLLGGRPREES